jgi:AcrR family transcriptional regulator
MTKTLRRDQLMQLALEIVREEGTELLTLARLAERAGVSKPIAYQHFGTRAGLLIALFRNHDDQTTEAVKTALESGGTTLEAVATILSSAYINSCLSMGPEVGAVFAALLASEETEGFRQTWRSFLIEEFRTAFTPFMNRSKAKSKPILMGFVGAAEILAEEATAKRLSRTEAISALSSIMIGTLKSNT